MGSKEDVLVLALLTLLIMILSYWVADISSRLRKLESKQDE